MLWPLLGARSVFNLIVGNTEEVLELLHYRLLFSDRLNFLVGFLAEVAQIAVPRLGRWTRPIYIALLRWKILVSCKTHIERVRRLHSCHRWHPAGHLHIWSSEWITARLCKSSLELLLLLVVGSLLLVELLLHSCGHHVLHIICRLAAHLVIGRECILRLGWHLLHVVEEAIQLSQGIIRVNWLLRWLLRLFWLRYRCCIEVELRWSGLHRLRRHVAEVKHIAGSGVGSWLLLGSCLLRTFIEKEHIG